MVTTGWIRNGVSADYIAASRIQLSVYKGPFIATQHNSTQLDVELSCVAINGP